MRQNINKLLFNQYLFFFPISLKFLQTPLNNQFLLTNTFHLLAANIYAANIPTNIPTSIAYLIIFASEKAKTAKNIWDKNALAASTPAAGTVAPTFQF